MAPRKLSDSDKNDIIELYKQPGQTTSTLASQYGVSNSTISRILKTTLPPEEYSQLISQKRMAGADKSDGAKTSGTVKNGRRARKRTTTPKKAAHDAAAVSVQSELSDDDSAEADITDQPTSVAPPKLKTAADKEKAQSTGTTRRRRRRKADADEQDEQLPLLADAALETQEAEAPIPASTTPMPILATSEEEDDEDDDLLGLDETLGDDFGDDDLDEALEDEDDELDDDDEALASPKPKLKSAISIQIMPLAEAVLPKPSYLVVDMRSELITRPLSEFADLGQIPTSEEKSKTLPVFDNHRVARRFSRNKQRVIKVPDGSLISRTSPYLQAKGITRLLVDGQVFDLVNSGL